MSWNTSPTEPAEEAAKGSHGVQEEAEGSHWVREEAPQTGRKAVESGSA